MAKRKRCTAEGCTKGAADSTELCIAHGGGLRCSAEGCTKGAVGSTELCIAHGGGLRCSAEGCTKSARGSTELCITHGGGRRCTTEGCTKGAIDSTELCAAHGGGRRCTAEGCTKGAVDSNELCITHGGGRRCTAEGCTKSARDSTELCAAHGGGRRCTTEGCTKSAVGSTKLCMAHGGGRRCSAEGCTKSARDSNELCITHGGGRRCEMQCCVLVTEIDTPTIASGKHPETGQYMCTFAMRNMVQEAKTTEKEDLNRYFGFKKTLVMRGEHSFYHKLVLSVPFLAQTERVLDESVLRKQLGKRKDVSDPRPDYFHYLGGSNTRSAFALSGEYDEKPDHEQSLQRLQTIGNMTDAEWTRTYVFRVQAHHDTERAVCVRKSNKQANTTYYEVTDVGKAVVAQTAVVVEQIMEWIQQGLPPDDAAGRPHITHINY